ncbi:MAG: hypothetical protein ACO3TI_06395 [Aquiluna sp.]
MCGLRSNLLGSTHFLFGRITKLFLDGAGGVGIDLLQGSQVLLEVRHEYLHGRLIDGLLADLRRLVELKENLDVDLVVVGRLDLDGESGGKHGRNLARQVLGLIAHTSLRVLKQAAHQ